MKFYKNNFIKIYILIIIFIFSCNKGIKNQNIQANNNIIDDNVIIEQNKNEIILNSINRIINNDINHIDNVYIIKENKILIKDLWDFRNEPNMNSEKIKVSRDDFNFMTSRISLIEFDIIEYTGIEEIDYDKNIIYNWYKIKHNDIEGYIPIETYFFDIDNNGINDYFFYRYSYNPNNNIDTIHPNDIFIYINNERIDTENIKYYYNNREPIWDSIYFIKENGSVNIIISEFGSIITEIIFRINPQGIISFIKHWGV